MANAAGGVHGRRIDHMWRDDQGQPDLNRQSATELVRSPAVFSLTLGPSVASAATSADALDREGIPTVGFAAEAAWSEHKNMFSWDYYVSRRTSASVWGDYLSSAEARRVAVLDIALRPAARAGHATLVASPRLAGVNIVLESAISSGPVKSCRWWTARRPPRLTLLSVHCCHRSSRKFW